MSQKLTVRMVFSAIFAALICVSTMLVQIPIPATGGYANLGDGVILLCAFMMPNFWAVAAAGLGSMLADILTGYLTYAPATLIIKAGVAWVAGCIFHHRIWKGNENRRILSIICGGITAEVWMVLGYLFFEAVLLGMGAGAMGGVLGNAGQGAVGILVCLAVAPFLKNVQKKWIF